MDLPSNKRWNGSCQFESSVSSSSSDSLSSAIGSGSSTFSPGGKYSGMSDLTVELLELVWGHKKNKGVHSLIHSLILITPDNKYDSLELYHIFYIRGRKKEKRRVLTSFPSSDSRRLLTSFSAIRVASRIGYE
jgi:hypothetical protein